eukprot:gb/GECG01005660.1/.p1 GENE.gb/GECG01005660.1/~~gb/GECG01005660.1/.p1  ORF type:complete len:849 (+),score=88.65 gb/GECG01005660.1/:1-2547(+)
MDHKKTFNGSTPTQGNSSPKHAAGSSDDQTSAPFTPPKLEIRSPERNGPVADMYSNPQQPDHIEQLFRASTPALQRARSIGSFGFELSLSSPPPVHPSDGTSPGPSMLNSLHGFVSSEDTISLREELDRIAENAPKTRLNIILDEVDPQGFTPLILAAGLQTVQTSVACIKLLLERGASVYCKDKEGFTALHWAAACGGAESVRVLVAYGARVNEKSNNLDTPLHRACRLGRNSSIMALLDSGADISSQNEDYMDPMDVAGIFQGEISFKLRKDSADALYARYPCLRTLVLHHEDFLLHKPREEHQEHSQRASYVLNRLVAAAYSDKGSCVFTKRSDLKDACIKYPLASPEVSLSSYTPKMKSKWAKIPDVGTIWPQKWFKGSVAGVYADSFYLSSNFRTVTWEQVQLAHSRRYTSLVRSLDDHVRAREHPVPFTPVVQRGVQRTSLNDLKQPCHSDTYFSSGTLKAALRAAGAVCHAVDQVLQGTCRNALCVVRPPGHHAGESGLINDGESFLSCGFCVFNSIAIGALHALNRSVGPRPEKVAIIDFDVHHGNGTEEIVKNYIRRTKHVDHLFFFSVHLWDEEKETETNNRVSDDNPDTPSNASQPNKRRRRAKSFGDDFECSNVDAPRPESSNSQNSVNTASDTSSAPAPNSNESSFRTTEDELYTDRYKSSRFYPGSGLDDNNWYNVINCPVSPLWRSSAHHKNGDYDGSEGLYYGGRHGVRSAIKQRLLPALRAYNPDLILISAGFDGGKGDAGNLSSDGTKMGLDLSAEDYEWMTSQIMRVSRICCPGHVVSVMEGGYGEWKLMEGSTTSDTTNKPYLKRNNLADNCVRHFQSIVLNGSRPNK